MRNRRSTDRYEECSNVADDICYVANVGDSRCIMSAEGGRSVLALSQDHKPNEEGER